MQVDRWQRLKSMYDSVMDLSRVHRNAYLDALTGRSIAFDLSRLLSQQDKLDGFLETPAWDVIKAEDEPPPPLVLQIGEVLSDRFEVQEFLGAGGMGEVYRVWDRDLGQSLALKTLRADIARQDGLVRHLCREVQLARRVTHPNICRLHDVGRLPGGSGAELTFFTMELLRGRTLSETVRANPLPPRQVIGIAEQLISGLAAAHQAGIIHRDLKSGNIILVENTNGSTRAVITDFGLAREITPAGGEPLSVLNANAAVGTPAYMAPEQLQGAPVTTAADLYALGVVLFEASTGRLPFEGSTPLAIGLKRLREQAPDVRRFASDVPDALRHAISSCLQRDPHRRPKDAASVGLLLSGRIRPPFIPSRRWILAGAGAGALALTTLIRQPWRPPTGLREAEARFRSGQELGRRRTQAALLYAIVEYERALDLEPDMAKAWVGLANAHWAMVNLNLIQARPGLDRARQAASRAVQIQPDSAAAHAALGYVMSIDVRRWLQALPHLENALALNPNDSDARTWLAGHLVRLGHFDRAVLEVETGLRRQPAFHPLLYQRAINLFYLHRFDEYLRNAEEIVRLQPVQNAYQMLARALEWTGRYEDALGACEQAERYDGGPVVLSYRACIEAARGKRRTAVALAEKVRKHWENSPFQSLLLAHVYCRLGKPADAMKIVEAGYQREDNSILSAPTSPYMVRFADGARLTRFRLQIGLPA